MIYCIEGRREIEKTETSQFLLADGSDKMVVEVKKSSFCGVKFSVS